MEFLYSINFIPGPVWWGIPVVVFLGFVLLVSIAILVVLKVFFSKFLTKQYYFWIFISVLWFPLFFLFFYQQIVEFAQAIPLLSSNNFIQYQKRVCDIDHNQKLGGSFCNLVPFISLIYQEIPLGSSLFMFSGTARVYLEYQLTNDYIINNDITKAEYVLIYLQTEELYYDSEGTLYQRDSGGEIKKLGQFDFVSSINPSIFILKNRVNN